MDMFKYRLKGIYHSGRKGTRWEKVTQPKYDDMVGCLTTFDPESVEQFQSVRFYLKDHPVYRWWDTSGIIQLSLGFDGDYYLETINSIYVFEEVKE